MRRTALILVGSVAGLFLLIVIGAAIAVATVDPNRLIDPVRARIKAATGRDLALNGKISIKPSLTPTLTIDDVSFGNAPWAHAPQLATVKQVEVQVALVPLLQRRYEVEHVTLVEPHIALESDKQGRGNWEFGGSGTSGAAPTGTAAPVIPALGLGALTIRDGTLTYLDDATGKTTTVAIETFTVHARSGEAPVDAQFRGKIDDVPVAINGNFGPLDQLRTRRWPYPVAVKGQVEGKDVDVATKVTSANGTLRLDELNAKLGASSVTGSVVVTTGGGRPRYEIVLHYPLLALDDAPLGAAAAPVKPASSPPALRYLIPDRPVPLSALRDADAHGEIRIDRLRVRPNLEFTALDVKFQLQGGKLEAPDVQGSGFGGTLRGRIAVDATNAASPSIVTRFEARDLNLAAILAAQGVSRDLSGGKTRAAVDLSMHGLSPHQWASTATGSLLMVVGPAKLSNTKLDLSSWFDQLGGAINPFRQSDPTTDLTCAVVRLPLTGGIAQVDRSIAAETTKFAASASGTLDFRNETLDLVLHPQIRQGIAIPLTQVADLVRFRGPFEKPQVTIDAMRSAETVARIGAAIGTSGLSILGESLFNATQVEGAGACAVALNPRAAKDAGGAPSPANPANLPADLGKALGNLFKH